MSSVLIDTHYLIAVINRLDQWHAAAIEITPKLLTLKIIVTESVFIETLNYFSEFRAEVKQHAAESVEKFAANPNITVVEQTPEVFANGLRLYKARLDKGYSMTDCISMNFCRELGITEVLTHDEHFRQEGFQILL